MTTSKSFDVALYEPVVPGVSGDAIVINSVGPPYSTKFVHAVSSPNTGVTVAKSIPQATLQNQILVSDAGMNWILATNPATAAVVPAPKAANHVLVSDSVPSWQDSDVPTMLALGGAITVNAGGTFIASVNLAFTPGASLTTRIDGGNPDMSRLDNFTIDCGTF